MASVVAVIQNSNSEILFVQRSAASSRALQWCLPGGRIKPGEDPFSAIIREVFEETQLQIQPVRQLADYGDQCYLLCELHSENIVILNARECAAFSWIDPSKILWLGFIMDLQRLRAVLQLLGIRVGGEAGRTF